MSATSVITTFVYCATFCNGIRFSGKGCSGMGSTGN